MIPARLRFWLKKAPDELRYSPHVRERLATLISHRAALSSGPASAAWLCRAISLCDREEAWQWHLATLQKTTGRQDYCFWKEALHHHSRLPAIVKKSPALTRSVILKAPSPGGEKGVLLLYFEYNLARILLGLSQEELTWLGSHFEIILAASWTPTDYALLALAASVLPDGLWVQPATNHERKRLAAFSPAIRLLPGLACDWINPAFYTPKPADQRSIDILMIANWGDFKRHWEFFNALREMPAGLRIVLVGQKEGRNTRESILTLARQFSVPQELDIRESIPIEEVTRLQCDARVSVVMSRREGGCVALVESLFAGCAIGMREDASIGSMAHINSETGSFLRPRHLAEDLLNLLKKSQTMKPYLWAADNISCFHTAKRINEALKFRTNELRQPWTQDFVQPHWRPYPVIIDKIKQVELASTYGMLNELFPQVFGRNLIVESCK